MNHTKKMLMKLLIVMSILVCSQAVYATDTRFTQTDKASEAPKVASSPNTTTSQTITFGEDEYVRITQPIQKDGITSTFEEQINVMGEARKGTNITLKVYLSTSQEGNTISNQKPAIYKLTTVGAAQTFNQLIDLEEGYNTVMICYTNENTQDVYGEIKLVIKRQPEETKEAIKNFRVDSSNAILDKVGK